MKYKNIWYLPLAIFLVSCASTTKLKDIQSLTTNAPALNSPEEKKIIKKSNELHQEFLEKGLIVKHELANNYIQSIANRIAPSFEHPEIKLNYYILKDASINASALPNGNIYLNVGLISKLSSEDQLAFVMAHEIAHVIERHGLKKKIDLKNTMVTSHVANFVLMGTNLIYLATISDLASFSRKTEGEADYEAMKYITKSAYSLDEGKESLVRLRQVKYKKEEASAWATHKDLNQRVLDFEQKKQKHDWVSSLAPSDNHVYEQFRSAVAEQVVKIRIRGKLFELAADVVEQELALQSNSAMWHFYLAEVNRLKAMEVTEYAKEYSWLHDIDNDEKLLLELEGKKNNLLATAKKGYQQALALDDKYILSFRGLGQLALAAGENDIAKAMFEKYLLSKGIRDRRYIESLKSSI